MRLVALWLLVVACGPIHAAKNRGWLGAEQIVRGDSPLARMGYGIALVDDLTIIFGGDVLGSPANDVHVLSSTTRTWTELTGALEGSRPTARSKMGFAGAKDGRIYMFGGIGRTLAVYMFGGIKRDFARGSSWCHPIRDLINLLWARIRFCAGMAGTDPMDDLWELNIEDLEW